jgi:hypothetical protein
MLSKDELISFFVLDLPVKAKALVELPDRHTYHA